MDSIINQNVKSFTENRYPGRGIIIGGTPDKTHIVQIYFISGRSVNSRNRVFVAENNEVKTTPCNWFKVKDPSLIIYNVTKVYGNNYIVTNGDHTDTICDALECGDSFEDALQTRTFEPDPPIYTPRISGITVMDKKPSYKLSILKPSLNDGKSAARYFFVYKDVAYGYGHMIHVYNQDGNPPPPFAGEPRLVPLFDSIDQTLEFYWNALDEDNKISIMAKFIPVKGGRAVLKIINKYKVQEE